MIIAFGHRRNVGKDSACNFLLTELRIRNIASSKFSFAKKLKDSAAELYGYLGLKDYDYYEKNYAEKDEPLPCGRTPRDIWLAFGAATRAIDQRVWVEPILKITGVVLNSDLRFPDEAEAIQSAGGVVVKINRDVPKFDDAADSGLDGFTDWDYVLNGNCNLAELNKRVIALYERITNG